MPALVVFRLSGTGKCPLTKMLKESYPSDFSPTISHTSRQPRPGEVDGTDYHFVSETIFINMIWGGKFVEWVEVNGNYFGTSVLELENAKERGGVVLLEVNPGGAEKLKFAAGFEARYVLMAPTSLDVLEDDLRARGTETEDGIWMHKRQWELEMQHIANNDIYDRLIVHGGGFDV